MRLSPHLRRALRPLARASAESHTPVFLVGGCIRDGLLSGVVSAKDFDVDLIVEFEARRLAAACVRIAGGTLKVFDRFGTVRLRFPTGMRIDIARARAEIYSKPAALPDVRTASLARDLDRRDFSINAMASRLDEGTLGPVLDLHGGQRDLVGG